MSESFTTLDSFIRRRRAEREDAEFEAKLDEADQRSENLMDRLKDWLGSGDLGRALELGDEDAEP